MVSSGRHSVAAVAESYLWLLLSWRYTACAVLGCVRLSVGVRSVASVVAAVRLALARAYRVVTPLSAWAAPLVRSRVSRVLLSTTDELGSTTSSNKSRQQHCLFRSMNCCFTRSDKIHALNRQARRASSIPMSQTNSRARQSDNVGSRCSMKFQFARHSPHRFALSNSRRATGGRSLSQ